MNLAVNVCGPTKSGKTRIANLIATTLAADGIPAIVSDNDLITEYTLDLVGDPVIVETFCSERKKTEPTEAVIQQGKEILKFINSSPTLLSLLYDLNLLPEQLEDYSEAWAKMMLVAVHFKHAIEHAKKQTSS